MAFRDLPIFLDGLNWEFAQDVLEDLQRHKCRMHNCPVWKVESKLDGSIAIWFHGWRPDGMANAWWEGAIRFNFPLLQDKKWLGEKNAIVEATLQMLEDIATRERPLIIRAPQNG